MHSHQNIHIQIVMCFNNIFSMHFLSINTRKCKKLKVTNRDNVGCQIHFLLILFYGAARIEFGDILVWVYCQQHVSNKHLFIRATQHKNSYRKCRIITTNCLSFRANNRNHANIANKEILT